MHTAASRWVAVLMPILAFIALASWAVSSAVGSSPDDDFHLASIWCGLGERPGVCENPGDAVERLVPGALATATCYAYESQESGACWDPNDGGMVRVDRANADGLYPRVYYAVMSTLVGPDVPGSVLAMRLLNSAIAVGLLTAVFWALPRWMRPALVVSVLATSVPLGMFVLSSVNPSSWAILSAATVWITLYGTTQTTGKRRGALAVLYLLGCVMGAGARADAAAYAILGTLLALILGARNIRSQAIPLLASVVGIALSVVLYLSAWQGDSVATGMVQGNPPLSAAELLSNALEIPSLWLGGLGGWGLGWLDTPLPGLVVTLSSAVFFGACFVGLRRVGWRRGLAVSLSVAALWAVPFVLLYQSDAVVGELVQPRYVLPLMVMALGLASLRPDAHEAWGGARLWSGGIALTAAFSVALHTNIRRYTTGLDEFHVDPGANSEWWWGGPLSPMVAWIIGTIAFGAVVLMWALILPGAGRRSSFAEPPDKSEPECTGRRSPESDPGSGGAVEKSPDTAIARGAVQ